MPDARKNIKALIRILSEDQRRVLAIYYDSIVTADRVVKIIDQSFPDIKKKTLRLSQFSQEEIIPLLTREIDDLDKGFLYIFDLEHAGFVYSSTSQTYQPTQFLTLVNLQRENFFSRNKDGKIIFFVNKAFIQQIKQYMADFWDWIFYHFEFTINDFDQAKIKQIKQEQQPQPEEQEDDILQLEKEVKHLLKDKKADRQLVLDRLVTLIDSYIAEGMVTYATEWVNKATKIAHELKRHDISAELNEKIANYFIDRGNWKKAEKYLSNVLEIRKKHLLAKKKDLGDLYNKLAYISKMLGDLDSASKYFSRVAKEHLNREKVLDLAQSYCDLAKVFLKTHEYSRAVNYAEKSLDLRRKVLPVDSEIIARNYYQIGKIYYYMKKKDLAKKFLEKARRILKKIGEEENSKLSESIESLYRSIK